MDASPLLARVVAALAEQKLDAVLIGNAAAAMLTECSPIAVPVRTANSRAARAARRMAASAPWPNRMSRS